MSIDSATLGLLLGQPGECRLTLSGSNLLLSPYNGNRININGTLFTIPAAGITLAPTGATVNTTYYIYLYNNAGTLALEQSTTGHETDSNSGNEIKSGDATRTLVGMARAVSGPSWVDSSTQRFVRSWFNPVTGCGQTFFTAPRTTTSNTFVEVDSEIRFEFVVFAGEVVHVTACGDVRNDTVSQNTGTAIGFDGTTPEEGSMLPAASISNARMATSVTTVKAGLSEGYHYATILGRTDTTTATATWHGSTTVANRFSLQAAILRQ